MAFETAQLPGLRPNRLLTSIAKLFLLCRNTPWHHTMGATAFALFDATPRPINSITKAQTQRGTNHSLANWNTTPLFVPSVEDISAFSLCFIFLCHTKTLYPSLLKTERQKLAKAAPMIAICRSGEHCPEIRSS